MDIRIITSDDKLKFLTVRANDLNNCMYTDMKRHTKNLFKTGLIMVDFCVWISVLACSQRY